MECQASHDSFALTTMIARLASTWVHPKPRHRGVGPSCHIGGFTRERKRLRLLESGLPVLCAMALLVPAASLASAVGGLGSFNPVTEVHCDFVDSSRSVPDYATQPPSAASKVRSLPTTIWLPPSGAPDLSRPLVLFAAGYDSYPGVYAPLLAAWARAGFVVAAPTFPDENPAAVAAQRTNTEGDLANEPADLAYVGHALERASARRAGICPRVFGMIEPHVLVVAGHSDGATAAALFAFGTGSDPQGVPESVLRAGFSLRAALNFLGRRRRSWYLRRSGPPSATIHGPKRGRSLQSRTRCRCPLSGASRRRTVLPSLADRPTSIAVRRD